MIEFGKPAGEGSDEAGSIWKFMNRFVRMLAIVFAAIIVATVTAGEPQPALQQVEQKLRPLLAGLDPKPTIEYPEHSQSMIVRYRPQKYFVHGRTKTGEWSTNVFEEIGPSFTGFVLGVNLQRAGEVNQAVTPQEIREPYWRTFLEVTPIAGTTNQIYWALSYAGRTDAQLVESIKKALGSLSGKKAGE